MNLTKEQLGGVSEVDAKKILGIISVYASDAKVILFGSRADGTYHEKSDIDIALDGGSPLSRSVVHEIRAILNETSIPRLIDVVDFNTVNSAIKEQITKHGIVWKS